MKIFSALLAFTVATAMAESFVTNRLRVESEQGALRWDAPKAVQDAVAAANRIAGKPYKYAGGHGEFEDDGYDCSGSTSYVLHAAGALEEARDSSDFLEYGEEGPGEWISIYVRPGHVFLVIADARFDTTDHANVGPGWREAERVEGFAVRHPKGL